MAIRHDRVVAPPAGPLTSEERWFFDVHGYLVRRGALSPEEVAVLYGAVHQLGLEPPGPSLASQRVHDLLARHPAFLAVVDHPAVFELVRELCGAHVRVDHAYALRMAPGTSGLGLHGGAVPFDPAQYYRVGTDGIACGLVAAQWVLVPQPEGSGGFSCIPGTHTASFATPWGPWLDALQVEVPLAAGDLVVFTEALVHGTLPWRGPGDRCSLFVKYSPGNSSWDQPSGAPAHVLERCSPRQRALFAAPAVHAHPPVP